MDAAYTRTFIFLVKKKTNIYVYICIYIYIYSKFLAQDNDFPAF